MRVWILACAAPWCCVSAATAQVELEDTCSCDSVTFEFALANAPQIFEGRVAGFDPPDGDAIVLF